MLSVDTETARLSRELGLGGNANRMHQSSSDMDPSTETEPSQKSHNTNTNNNQTDSGIRNEIDEIPAHEVKKRLSALLGNITPPATANSSTSTSKATTPGRPYSTSFSSVSTDSNPIVIIEESVEESDMNVHVKNIEDYPNNDTKVTNDNDHNTNANNVENEPIVEELNNNHIKTKI
eukprot:UN23321